MSGKNRSKKGHGKPVKVPDGLLPLKKCPDMTMIKNVDQKVIEFADNMLSSTEWESYCSRPRTEVFGYYAICRWYPRDKSWAILYIGRGNVRTSLDQLFSGHQRSPLGNYLSSFPRDSRNLIWTKWFKDPYYPYEGMEMKQLLDVVQYRYNSGEQPAFNMNLDIKEEPLPNDFSIVPNWSKGKKKEISA